MDNRDIHVLSIEDNPGDAMLIEEKLTTGTRIGWGLPTFTVARVSRLQQGLARLEAAATGEAAPIDVVLTDLDLPDSRAGETFKTLRQRFPYLPIVVLTGREDVDLARTSVQAGAQDYLYKDEATGSLLAHAIIYAIERQENARALQEAHDQLEARVTARTHELRERLKELTCLYAVNRDLQADLSTDALCRRTVENLAAAMAFPDLAIPVIELDDRRYPVTPESDVTSPGLRAAIKVGGKVRGHVQVIYTEDRPFLLPEEQNLVNGVAEALSTWLDRKQATAQTRFQAQLLDSVQESVVATDLTGRVIYWGKGAEVLYGWSAEEVMDKPITIIVDPRQVEEERLRMQHAVEAGRWHGEYRQKRKDGTSFWSATSISLVRDAEGRPTGLIGIDRDITARKQAESQQAVMLRALRANQERLRTTVELAPMGVGIVDSRGNLIDCNTALAELVGYDREALLRLNYADFTHPEDLAREKELIAALWEGTATEYRMEKRYLHKDGHTIWVDVTAFLFEDDKSELAYGFAFVQDIAERKQADARREAAFKSRQDTHQRQVEDLHWLTDVAQHLLSLSDEDEILTYATRALQRKLRDCIVLTLTRGEEARTLKLRELQGLDDSMIGQAIQLIGFDPKDTTFTIMPEFEALYRQGRLHRHEKGLPEFAASELPKPLAEALARLLAVQDVYTIGLVGRQRVLGNIHIMARGSNLIQQRELIESFAGQIALALEQASAHRALEESEARLRTIIEHSTNLFYTHTPDHQLTYVSPQVREFLDCEPEEAKIRWTEFSTDHPTNQAGLTSTEEAIETGVAQPPYELELVGKNGRTIWVEVREAPVVEDGETIAIVGSLTDITERKKAEAEKDAALAALRESEERYRRLVERSPDILYIYAERRGALYWSQRVQDVLGYAPDELLEHPYVWHDAIHPDDIAEVDAAIIESARGAGFDLEYRIQDNEGKWHWFHDRLISKRQVEGETIIEGLATDITERRRAEEALRRVRYSIDRVVDSILWVDENGNFIDVNDAACRTLEYSREELLTMGVSDIDPYYPEERWGSHWEAMIKCGTMTIESIHQTKHGRMIPVEVIIHNQKFEGIRYNCVLARDITARKEAERALRESRALLARAEKLAHVGSWEWDLTKDVFAVSEGWRHIHGINEKTLTRDELFPIAHPDDRPMINEAWANALEGDQPYEIEHRIIRQDNGEIRIIRAYGEVIRDARDRPIKMYGAAQDITERKQAEAALQESLIDLKLAQEIAGIGNWQFDPSTGIPVWSDQVYNIYNRDPQLGPPHIDDYRQMYEADQFTVFNTAIQRAIKDGEPYDITLRLELPGGIVKWIRAICQPDAEKGPAGHFLRGTIQDITDIKRIEESLRDSETRFRTIINALPQFVAYNDKDLVYRFVNRTYQEKFGVNPEDVVGKTLPEVIGEAAFEEARPHVEEALSGEQVRYHQRYDYAIGGTRDIDGILVPDIAEDGEVRGYYAVLTDITPYMEMQESLHQTTERLRIEHEIDTAILRAQSSEAIAHAVLVRLDRLLPCRHIGISEIDLAQLRGRELIRLIDGDVYEQTSTWRPLAEIDSRLMDDVRKGRIYHVQDIAARKPGSPLEQALQRKAIRSYVSVPLMAQDTTIGTLNAGSEAPDFFESKHIEIMENVATSLAVALQQARLLEQTRQDAETRALLLREVNHRVKNNLDAIIGLLYIERRFAPPEALPAYQPIMEDLTRRITGLAQVHQMLSEAEWTPLSLSELAERIIQTTAQSWVKDLKIKLDVESSPVRIQPDQAQHLALILSELATNTLKYAVADRETVNVAVRISQEGDTIQLVYQNDGPGYPEDVLNLERHNAGLDIIKRSVEKNLRGELILRNDNGAVTIIRFPREDGD